MIDERLGGQVKPLADFLVGGWVAVFGDESLDEIEEGLSASSEDIHANLPRAIGRIQTWRLNYRTPVLVRQYRTNVLSCQGPISGDWTHLCCSESTLALLDLAEQEGRALEIQVILSSIYSPQD